MAYYFYGYKMLIERKFKSKTFYKMMRERERGENTTNNDA